MIKDDSIGALHRMLSVRLRTAQATKQEIEAMKPRNGEITDGVLILHVDATRISLTGTLPDYLACIKESKCRQVAIYARYDNAPLEHMQLGSLVQYLLMRTHVSGVLYLPVPAADSEWCWNDNAFSSGSIRQYILATLAGE